MSLEVILTRHLEEPLHGWTAPSGRPSFQSILPIVVRLRFWRGRGKNGHVLHVYWSRGENCKHPLYFPLIAISLLSFNADGLPFASAFRRCPRYGPFVSGLNLRAFTFKLHHGFYSLAARRHVLLKNVEGIRRQQCLELIKLSNSCFVSRRPSDGISWTDNRTSSHQYIISS